MVISGRDYESKIWSIVDPSPFLIFKSYLHHGSGRVQEEPEGGKKSRLCGRDLGSQSKRSFPIRLGKSLQKLECILLLDCGEMYTKL